MFDLDVLKERVRTFIRESQTPLYAKTDVLVEHQTDVVVDQPITVYNDPNINVEVKVHSVTDTATAAMQAFITAGHLKPNAQPAEFDRLATASYRVASAMRRASQRDDF